MKTKKTLAKLRARLKLNLITLMLAPLLMSCEAEELSINLVKVIPLDPFECDTKQTEKGAPVTSGAFDLVLGSTYSLNLAAANALVNIVAAKEFDPKDGRVNTNNINLTRLSVEYIDADGVDLGLDPVVDIPLTGQLTTDMVEALVIPDVVVFTSQMTEILRENSTLKGTGLSGPVPVRGSFTVILQLTLFGETVDQRKVQSNKINFPVEICTGCRVRGSCDDELPLTEDELEQLAQCPNGIGKDAVFASCQLCKELALPELAQLCEP